MLNISSNPKAETVEAVRAHIAERVELLASCARAATGMTNAATRWAYSEARAIRSGLTTVADVQASVCEKFPKLTANGKPSKTPNSSFKTSFDKFVLLADVLAGTHKTYQRAEAKALAEAFVADGNALYSGEGDERKLRGFKLSLNDVVDQIKADHMTASRAASANETEEEKAKRKAAEEEALVQQFAGTVSVSPAMLNALAKRIEAFGVEEAPLAEALANVREAIGGFAERLAASEQKLAA